MSRVQIKLWPTQDQGWKPSDPFQGHAFTSASFIFTHHTNNQAVFPRRRRYFCSKFVHEKRKDNIFYKVSDETKTILSPSTNVRPNLSQVFQKSQKTLIISLNSDKTFILIKS